MPKLNPQMRKRSGDDAIPYDTSRGGVVALGTNAGPLGVIKAQCVDARLQLVATKAGRTLGRDNI